MHKRVNFALYTVRNGVRGRGRYCRKCGRLMSSVRTTLGLWSHAQWHARRGEARVLLSRNLFGEQGPPVCYDILGWAKWERRGATLARVGPPVSMDVPTNTEEPSKCREE